MDLCHLKHSELAKHLQRLQRKSRAPQSSVHGARRISFSSGGGNIREYNLQTSRYGRRSQRRSTSLYAGRHVGSSQIAEITRERMPTRMYEATTQSKTKTTMAHSCPQVCMRLPPSRRPQQWDTIDESVVLLERNLFGHLLDRTGIGEKMGRCACEAKWRQRANTGMSLSRRKPQLFLSVNVKDTKKRLGREKNVGPMWNIPRTRIDLEDPIPFFESSTSGVHLKEKQKLIMKHFYVH